MTDKADGRSSTVTVEHRITNNGGTSRFGGGRSLLFGMKPVVVLVGAYAVLATGAWGFLLPFSMGLSQEVQKLEKEVGRLEAAVDRLSVEVDELEIQVDRYEEQNEKLEENNEEFARQIALLNASNAEYEAQNGILNSSIAELENQNDRLNASNSEYESLNAALNETNAELTEQVDALKVINANLSATADEYSRLNDELREEVDRINLLNQNLTNQLEELNNSTEQLKSEVESLSALNSDLNTILSFIEEEAKQVDQTYEKLAAILAQQIDRNRGIAIITLSRTYQQISTGWVCKLRVSGLSAVGSPDSPIGAGEYNEVMGYVGRDLLVPLCLDFTNFELFLARRFNDGITPPIDATVNEVVSAGTEYSTDAFDHYFPRDGNDGLTDEDWASAEYDCKNLPPGKLYVWEE